MSVFYDEASLVLVPSGYKASKVYAQKPLTADGQLTFSRASTATRVNASGLVETVASNVPRLDYLGSTCPKLLLEPQRTNLLTYSEAFNVGASWDKSDVTVTADTTVSPSGIQNADTINATADGQRINQSITVSASTQYTFSFYAKKGTMATPRYSVFDLSNGAFILTQVDYSSLVNTSTWSRITATFTTPAGCTSVGVYPINGASNGTIFLWGAQLESGAHPTSYIPTEGTAVTRLGDFDSSSNMFGTSYASSNFSYFIEFDLLQDSGISNAPMLFGGGNSSIGASGQGYLRIGLLGNNSIALFGHGDSLMASVIYAFTKGTRYKLLVKRSGTSIKFYVNGAQVGATGTSSLDFTLRSIGWSYGAGSYNTYGNIYQFLAFQTALSDADAIALTA
jgi:hypothetical protein